MASRRAQTDEAALRPHQFLSLYVFVPSDDVRLVIGKGGATIQDLQATTNTKIRIDDDEETEEENLWRCVTIVGKLADVTNAYHKIESIVEDIDDCVAEFRVLKEKRFAIIGTSGQVVKRIGATTNARIYIPDRSDDDELIVLEGSFVQVREAYEAMMAKLRERGTIRNRTTIEFPTAKLGLLIGKHGATVKSIQARTGVHIEWAKDAPRHRIVADEVETNPDIPSTISATISGELDQVIFAQRIIQYLLDDHRVMQAGSRAEQDLRSCGVFLPPKGAQQHHGHSGQRDRVRRTSAAGSATTE